MDIPAYPLVLLLFQLCYAKLSLLLSSTATKIKNRRNSVEAVLSNPVVGVTVRSDNRKVKITGLNGAGRVFEVG